MNILCLAFIQPDYPQIYRKFAWQADGLRRAGHNVEAVVLGSTGPDLAQLGLRHVQHSYDRRFFFASCTSLLESLTPDMVYFRYPLADHMLHRFMLHAEGRVIFEHNTKEHAEISGELLQSEYYWGPRCRGLACGLVGVTREILEYQLEICERAIPGLALPNGHALSSLPPVSPPRQANHVHMFCAARYAQWHGMDRMLHGLARYTGPTPVTLHLAGDGELLDQYRQLAAELSLGSKVMFHGQLGQDAIAELAAQSHIAIGSLAYHRIGLNEICALKHREYAMQGIPFLYAGTDMDFPAKLPFVHVIPLDDAPVDMDAAVDFALATYATPHLRRDMRAYALSAIHWDTKMSTLAAFMKTVAPAPRVPSDAPLVSVIIPCYNQANFLPETYTSVVRQTWRDLEVIVIDDGSSDDTAQVAESLFAQHPDVPSRLVRQRNRGLSEARNAGIRAARGQWILTLDSDDMFRREFLAMAMEQLQLHPELNLISCAVQQFGHSRDVWTPNAYTPELLPEQNTFPAMCLFRKSLWEDAGGYDPSHPWGMEDWNFWLRCMRVGIVPMQLPFPGLLYRTHEGGSMYTRMMQHWEEAKALNHTMLPDIYGTGRVLQAHALLASPSAETEERIRHKQEQWPDLPMPHLWLGLAHEGRGELGEATARYLRAAALAAPDDWQPYLRLMLINGHLGRIQAAEKARKECLARNPELRSALTIAPARPRHGEPERADNHGR